MLLKHHYTLPSPEEIFASFINGKMFSKLDLSDKYLQILVDDKCLKLLTINTHREHYRFNRLTIGIKVASGIFNQVMDTILSGLQFITAYLDDILIKSKNKEEYRQHILEVFKQLSEYRFKLIKVKNANFYFDKKYLGQIIDENGRKPDPARASAIKNMPIPKNKISLQAFLGLANYYNVFVPNMHFL